MDAQTCIISDTDIAELTGYKIPSKQCEALKEAGIFFVIRRDGKPRTTWEHFNNPLTQRIRNIPSPQEPNFGALD
ncbi:MULTISPECIES: DUF4224 domain-containing protein [Photorhabdus]|uniref:DUF4224 domain-containing protein n=1 Tax=Photorhabdus kayaii TaxID=230088 RepID=A0ABX0B6W5_9GAMM|nr:MULTISPECIES: DUF4224 domain-containing protein [Photorhabdus]MCC8376501.1 DUF4224 domain-containing protein [Photorhabdus bodei]MCT8353883.1 DUF4224 domain-containing protein [Photorhabdus kayaii]NDL13359.1 DUF4224 domain-containing protein [Photorhabdus kayaii]NDL27093.1 DUF4224 domain-containing protein [Photorhabdus kayaii]RAX08037.1 hypothetical protein CKY10_16335 [Photorhabdus sp. HUG-39]